MEELLLNAMRLEKKLRYWDEQLLKLIDKYDALNGNINLIAEKRINELQGKVIETKRNINEIYRIIENETGFSYLSH